MDFYIKAQKNRDERLILALRRIGDTLKSQPDTANGFAYWSMIIDGPVETALNALGVGYCNANGLIFPTPEDAELYKKWV